MSRHALIDFGSNTIRLCVYDVNTTSPKSVGKKDLSILLNYKVMAGISSYIEDGVLSEKGIKKAARTIREQCQRAAYFTPEGVEVFATAVLRNCSNSAAAKDAIEEACGQSITLLTTEEEAHLGLVGAQTDGAIEDAVVVDIGGGSTELTAMRNAAEQASASLPQGSLSSFSAFVRGILPTEMEEEEIARSFRDRLAALPVGAFASQELVGIGGAIRSAAKVYGDCFCAGKRSNVLLLEHIEEILEAYHADAGTFMSRALQTIPDRIHTFIPGCILIKEVFSFTGARQLRIAKHGLREGYLIERILRKKA